MLYAYNISGFIAWNMWNVPKSPVHSPYTPPARLEGKLIEEGIGGSHLEERQGNLKLNYLHKYSSCEQISKSRNQLTFLLLV